MEKRDAHIVIDGIGEFDVKLSELTIDMEVDVSAPEFRNGFSEVTPTGRKLVKLSGVIVHDNGLGDAQKVGDKC